MGGWWGGKIIKAALHRAEWLSGGDKIRCYTLQSWSKIVLGGLGLKRGFCQGCVLNFSLLSAVKRHEWRRVFAGAPAVLAAAALDRGGLRAIGFCCAFLCIYLCFRGPLTGALGVAGGGGPRCVTSGVAAFPLRGRGRRRGPLSSAA